MESMKDKARKEQRILEILTCDTATGKLVWELHLDKYSTTCGGVSYVLTSGNEPRVDLFKKGVILGSIRQLDMEILGLKVFHGDEPVTDPYTVAKLLSVILGQVTPNLSEEVTDKLDVALKSLEAL